MIGTDYIFGRKTVQLPTIEPTAKWSLEETSGLVVDDSIGAQNGSLAVDASNYTEAGKIGNAFNFLSERSVTVSPLSYSSKFSFSFVFWEKESAESSIKETLWWEGGSGIFFRYWVYQNSVRVDLYYSDGTYSRMYIEFTTEDNISDFSLVGIVVDMEKLEMRCYVNTNLLSSVGLSDKNFRIGTSNAFGIGGQPNSSREYCYSILDEVRYFQDKALSIEEFKNIYNSEK